MNFGWSFLNMGKRAQKIPEGAERKRQNDIDKHDFSDGKRIDCTLAH